MYIHRSIDFSTTKRYKFRHTRRTDLPHLVTSLLWVAIALIIRLPSTSFPRFRLRWTILSYRNRHVRENLTKENSVKFITTVQFIGNFRGDLPIGAEMIHGTLRMIPHWLRMATKNISIPSWMAFIWFLFNWKADKVRHSQTLANLHVNLQSA